MGMGPSQNPRGSKLCSQIGSWGEPSPKKGGQGLGEPEAQAGSYSSQQRLESVSSRLSLPFPKTLRSQGPEG